MSKRQVLIIGVAAIGLAVVLGWCVNRLALASSRLAVAEMGFDSLRRDAQEIIELRSRQQVVNTAERPTQDVIAQVNAVLSEVGIPTNRVKSLTPESDGAINSAKGTAQTGSIYRKQSLRMTLENLTVQEIGNFLLQWRAAQKIWTAVEIELTHVHSSTKDKTGENRYDASIVLSAVYVSQN
jgi:hypothetical protein